jgi:aminopeptidase N
VLKDKILRYRLFYFLTIFLVTIQAAILITACDSMESNDYYSSDGQGVTLIKSEKAGIKALSDIPYYYINTEVDFNGGDYKGSVKIDYVNLEQAVLESLYFRLFPNGGGIYGNGFIKIGSVKVDGAETSSILSLDDSVMKVVLPEELSKKESIEIEISFNGKTSGEAGMDYGIHNTIDGVMTLSGWYPILAVYDDEGWNLDPVTNIGDSVYSDTAYYDIELITDEGLIVASTGVIIDSKSTDNKKIKYRMKSGPSRDFFMVMGRDFEVLTTNYEDTSINAYYLDGNKGQAKKTLDIAKGAMETFNKKFGTYPYTEMDLVELPVNRSIGIEFPGIMLISTPVFGNGIFTSHEIAHQWWYNIVGNDVIDEPWLDEALTSYSSIVYYEFNAPEAEYLGVLDYFESEYTKTLEAGRDDIVTGSLDHFEELGSSHYYQIVYIKGALFFDALRDVVGDEIFFNTLYEYFGQYKYDIASTEDILELFEETSGMKLDGLYDQWLYEKKGRAE